jgi:hypothetical protein
MTETIVNGKTSLLNSQSIQVAYQSAFYNIALGAAAGLFFVFSTLF